MSWDRTTYHHPWVFPHSHPHVWPIVFVDSWLLMAEHFEVFLMVFTSLYTKYIDLEGLASLNKMNCFLCGLHEHFHNLWCIIVYFKLSKQKMSPQNVKNSSMILKIYILTAYIYILLGFFIDQIACSLYCNFLNIVWSMMENPALILTLCFWFLACNFF